MDEQNIKLIIEDTFGKDLSSIIYPYMIGQCRICKICQFNDKHLSICKGCHKLVCENKCYGRYSPSYNNFSSYFNNVYRYYCKSCYINSILNN